MGRMCSLMPPAEIQYMWILTASSTRWVWLLLCISHASRLASLINASGLQEILCVLALACSVGAAGRMEYVKFMKCIIEQIEKYLFCYCQGETFDFPERVPFRLTHNMVAAMGPTGHEGIYRKACEVRFGNIYLMILHFSISWSMLHINGIRELQYLKFSFFAC